MMAQLMVGINIVSSKYLIPDMPILFLLVMRFLIASVFLYVIHLFIADKNNTKLSMLTGRDWQFIIAQALCAGALFNFLLLLGLNYTEASVAGIITSVLPAMIAIMSVIFLKERLTLLSILCITFAVLGLLIINAHNFASARLDGLLGDAIILLSLLPESTYYVLAKIYDNKLPLFFVATLMNAINLPVLLITMIFTSQWYAQFNWIDGVVLFIAGISSGLFYVFWFWGCKQVKGSVAGLFTAFMPVTTLIVAWIALGESITILQTCGMILVMISVVFNAKRAL